MIPTHSGSFRLFRFAGIDVFLHWSWFLAAWYFIGQRSGAYSSLAWNIAEYLTLFVIVLMHEFGHSLAARQVGGESRDIVLWPFGGIAFSKVPPRPGANLWTVAAGPLVNVVLVPVLWGLLWLAGQTGWAVANPDFGDYLTQIFIINLVLLVFNILPIYPLDGGQMLQALLWFKLGRARSLHVATIIGFVGVALLAFRAITNLSLFSGMIAAFLGMECHRGYKQAQLLKQVAQLPRHNGFTCPTCRERPPGGPHWGCPNCNNRFDPFSTRAVCPHCTAVLPKVVCAFCGSAHPIETWEVAPARRSGNPPVIDV